MTQASLQTKHSEQHSSDEPAQNPKIPVGISQCLLGDRVRFDGGHKRSRFCTDVLSEYFEFLPSCPELGAGLGVPRRAVRLVGDEDSPRVLDSKDKSIDVTDAMQAYNQERIPELGHLSGYIFMSKSPSCGLFRVKVYADNGYPQGSSQGVFAKAFTEAYPLIPAEEDGRLNDPVLLENFLVRVVVFDRWRQLSRQGFTTAGLLNFHQQIKFQLMAHSVSAYKQAGRLLANLKDQPLEDVAERYITIVMTGLRKIATRRTHTNVMQHIRGFVKKRISAFDRKELTSLIDDYYRGIVPLVVPMTMLKHHVQLAGNDYIKHQLYLQPHPQELGLRNRI